MEREKDAVLSVFDSKLNTGFTPVGYIRLVVLTSWGSLGRGWVSPGALSTLETVGCSQTCLCPLSVVFFGRWRSERIRIGILERNGSSNNRKPWFVKWPHRKATVKVVRCMCLQPELVEFVEDLNCTQLCERLGLFWWTLNYLENTDRSSLSPVQLDLLHQ